METLLIETHIAAAEPYVVFAFLRSRIRFALQSQLTNLVCSLCSGKALWTFVRERHHFR